MARSRYAIGIDLGTTNTVVAYVDATEVVEGERPPMRLLPLPQLVAEREVAARPSLPSFLYLPTAEEIATGDFAMEWETRPDAVAGEFAREISSLVPGRVVASAKSWLCYGDVDREAAILPWGGEETVRKLSPVEASSRYLAHIRDAWNHAIAIDDPGDTMRFERQEIVVTVPASFDEEARELTVEAALEAGLENFTLLEEPLAAFYAWIYSYRGSFEERLSDNDLVLVCDVGGGTSDFSLVRARFRDGEVEFERVAVGEHLLLGGDNLDLALAHRVEAKLGGARLSLRQRSQLRQQCRRAKERLLGDADVDREPISVLGAGGSVVGGTLAAELTADEVIETIVEGFLPEVGADARPARQRGAGLREIGLPYAADTAITRHLAGFLAESREAVAGGGDRTLVRPDAILFNGGFFTPEGARDHLVAVVAEWFSSGEAWSPRVLVDDVAESAVAVGAAYYGLVRRGEGVRIGGGSSRAYYLGVARDEGEAERAVCVVPRGAEEGERLVLVDRRFTVTTNRPVVFSLWSSTRRRDAHGDVIAVDEEELHRHAPLVTVLRYGRRSHVAELEVRVAAELSERGTVELWCEATGTPHRWRLQFQLGAPATAGAGPVAERAALVIPEPAVAEAERLIRAVFEPRDGEMDVTPESLMAQLEGALGYGRDSWPIDVTRRLGEVAGRLGEGRRLGPRHESRWLNLYGYCLRPGFGAPGDPERVERAWELAREGPVFARDVQCQVEWEVFLQRIAGGLHGRRQQELYERHRELLGIGERKPKRINAQIAREAWRVLASLEHLSASIRTKLGKELLKRLADDPRNRSFPWALARFGARAPLYGPLSSVVDPEIAERWIGALLELPEMTPEIAFAIGQIGARTNDPERDVDDDLRHVAVARIGAAGIRGDALNRLRRHVPQGLEQAARVFGESLPHGLKLAE